MNSDRIKKYRTQLLQLEKRLSGDLQELVGEIEANVSSLRSHSADTRAEIEADLVLTDNESIELADVRHALHRIEAGTFGVCQDCSGRIPAARLAVLPYTAFCVECEARRE